jgi:hypothetical protein
VPDAPITAFKLSLPASPSNSALAATADTCAAPLPLVATITGQNGKKADVNTVVEVAGCTVQITKTSVKKRTATLSVRIPAAGTVLVSGKGLKAVRKSYAKGGTYKVATKLNKAGLKALRKALKRKSKKQRKLVLKTTANYSPKKGIVLGGQAVKGSRASKRLTFKR